MGVNRTAFSVVLLTEKPTDREYWQARSPRERLRHMALLRRINYGDRATARLQRVLEVAQRP
jgi:hypothetical protein